MNPNEGKFKGKENLQHIITQNNYGVETDLIGYWVCQVKCVSFYPKTLWVFTQFVPGGNNRKGKGGQAS